MSRKREKQRQKLGSTQDLEGSSVVSSNYETVTPSGLSSAAVPADDPNAELDAQAEGPTQEVDEASAPPARSFQEESKAKDDEDEEWLRDTAGQTETPPPSTLMPIDTPSPREDPSALTAAAFSEASTNLKNAKTHELQIKVAPSEANRKLLEVAEQAIISSTSFDGRLIHREATRTILEVESRPVTIDIALSQDLDRIVLVKAFDPVPEHLFSVLRDAFSNQVQLSTRVPDHLAGVEEEHEEAIDGSSVKAILDQDYVNLLKREMKQRSERDLTAFATPLERRAKDDEKRVARLEKLLSPKYNACHLPVPALETPPALSSFLLQRADSAAMLSLRGSPTPREVDAQLKMAIRRDLHGDSLARQERKKKEVQARSEACERNRAQLVSVLSSSRAALELDLQLMSRLGVNPPQVALCRVPCVYGKRPGHLIACQNLIIFEPVGIFGFRLSGLMKLPAQHCRSVMKGRTTIGLVDSLCLRMDDQQEHMFYMATMEDTNEVLDQVFELIWQILRMNRWNETQSGRHEAQEGPDNQVVTV